MESSVHFELLATSWETVSTTKCTLERLSKSNVLRFVKAKPFPKLIDNFVPQPKFDRNALHRAPEYSSEPSAHPAARTANAEQASTSAVTPQSEQQQAQRQVTLAAEAQGPKPAGVPFGGLQTPQQVQGAPQAGARPPAPPPIAPPRLQEQQVPEAAALNDDRASNYDFSDDDMLLAGIDCDESAYVEPVEGEEGRDDILIDDPLAL
jgi:hypothetical protein